MVLEFTNTNKLFQTQFTREQCKDTGMAMVLICLLINHIGHINIFLPIAVLLLIADIICPKIFYPIAIVWFGLSKIIGILVSNILLIILFFALVVPVGVIRRVIGSDSLNLRRWKKDGSSVFKIKNKNYRPEDLEKPY